MLVSPARESEAIKLVPPPTCTPNFHLFVSPSSSLANEACHGVIGPPCGVSPFAWHCRDLGGSNYPRLPSSNSQSACIFLHTHAPHGTPPSGYRVYTILLHGNLQVQNLGIGAGQRNYLARPVRGRYRVPENYSWRSHFVPCKTSSYHGHRHE